MNKVFYAVGLSALVVSFSASADSMLRIKCDDQDVGAEVFINTKFVGSCPLDVPVREGVVVIQARKITNGEYEQLFEKQLRVVDDVVQKIELVMSAPQLTAEAKLKKDTAAAAAQSQREITEATTQLRAAEAGDVAAMRKIADYYDAGMGIKKDPAKAATWRTKAEATAVQGLLREAQLGNDRAMSELVQRYEAGNGVTKDPAQAQYWRDKLTESKRAQVAAAKEADKQSRIAQINWMPNMTHVMENIVKDDASVALTSAPTIFVASAMDIVTTPFNLTNMQMIKNEAAVRPAAWGNPDSMIAKASRQQKMISATEKLVAATQ
jgi:hypothetical protein